ncbi:MAG: oligopeptide/dipeptide ABC transporter ATP-binding protein [Nitrososphaerales archaeon]
MLPAGSTNRSPVITLDNLSVYFSKKKFLGPVSVVRAVDSVNLEIGRSEIVGLVGESGSGKTTLGRAAIGLQKATSGKVTFSKGEGQIDVTAARGREWRNLRRDLQIIFQDPFSSIDPNMRVFDALRIPLQAQGVRNKEEIENKILSVFKEVGLPSDIMSNFVFQLSGGQRQRVSIARVLLFSPSFVVADEAVSMLDVSLKGDILNIIKKIATNFGVGFLFITHEMAVAKVIADRIGVMYLGNIVELAPATEIISNPLHPYTKALLQASPTIDPSKRDVMRTVNIRGDIPASYSHPSGCKFHPRCPFVMEKCKDNVPQLKEIESGHFVSCWLY